MLIDVNVSLSRWPFRRLAGDEPAALVQKLRSENVVQAWAGSFDALLHKDIAAVNARVVEDCRQFGEGLLLPVGCVNPMLPDWQEDLRRCHEVHQMKVLRLHPNYHRYRLDAPEFKELLTLATQRKLIVQIAVKMEDERTQHPLVQVPMVDVTPLARFLPELPGARVLLLNALKELHGESLTKLVQAGEVFADISMLEGVGGVGKLAEQIGGERLLLGSLYPLFYFEAAKWKLNESQLQPEDLELISHANARRLLGGS